jgi:hypothetical protein
MGRSAQARDRPILPQPAVVAARYVRQAVLEVWHDAVPDADEAQEENDADDQQHSFASPGTDSED